MLKRLLFTVLLVFMLGWFANDVISGVYDNMLAFDFSDSDGDGFIGLTGVSGTTLKEKASPQDRIKESQIHVYGDRIILDIEDAEWSTFTDTNSMDPVLDYGANAIHIIPKSPDEINIGDIIAYESKYTEGTLIHRVVAVGADEKGIYYTLKGDNNPSNDPGKVRFEQVRRVLVAIIY